MFLLCIGCLLVGTVRAADAGGQSQSETGIHFNLSTPGARSLGMGGAFLALSDDATAAYTNPAGLTNLLVGGPEVAIEVRRWKYSNTNIDGGHVLGTPTNQGVDTLPGLTYSETTNYVNGLSFLSAGYVLPHGLAVALYRHELANFASEGESQGPVFGELTQECGDEPPGKSCTLDRFPPSRTRTSLSIVNYGVSAAYSVPMHSGGLLALGLGASYYRSDSLDRTESFAFRDGGRERGGFLGSPDFLPDNLMETDVERGRDTDLGFSLGLLWKAGKEQRWSLGAVYRKGPVFGTTSSVRKTQLGLERLGGLAAEGPEKGMLRVPDTYGLGVAYSAARGSTKVALDYNRARYSQRLAEIPDLKNDFRLDDAGEVHLGVEHVFLVIESHLVGTLRLGAWREPFHEPVYTGSVPLFQALFGKKGKDQSHASAGLGFVFKEDFQLDLAADFSNSTDTFSVSLVKFF
jgi:hypothetical protein